MQVIQNLLATLQSNLASLVIPVAICGTVLWFIAQALAPVIPDWAQGLRGYLQRLFLGVMLVGAAATLIGGLYSMAGGGAGGAGQPSGQRPVVVQLAAAADQVVLDQR